MPRRSSFRGYTLQISGVIYILTDRSITKDGASGLGGSTPLQVIVKRRGFQADCTRFTILIILACFVCSSAFRAQTPEGVPVFKITPGESTVSFDVESSVDIRGTFKTWDATLTFTSTDVATGVLDVKIQADSVDTGSSMMNGMLKGKNFFDVKRNPYITFKSTKIVRTGPDTFELDGDFTIRGVTKAEKLTVTVEGRGTGSGSIKGTAAFDRKQYGMNSGIPFIKVADRVEVTFNLKAKRVSGPPVAVQ